MSRGRLSLIIQQVEKEGPNLRQLTVMCSSCGSHGSLKCSRTAQERMNELEAKMENVLATIDKVFKVELMKMPPSLQNTRIGDLISGGLLTFLRVLCVLCLTFILVFEEEEEEVASDVSIALKVSLVTNTPLAAGVGNAFVSVQNESLLAPQSLQRVPSKRGDAHTPTRPPWPRFTPTRFILVSAKSTATPDNSTPPQRASAKASKVTLSVIILRLSLNLIHVFLNLVFRREEQLKCRERWLAVTAPGTSGEAAAIFDCSEAGSIGSKLCDFYRSSSVATKRSQSRTMKTAEHGKPRLRSGSWGRGSGVEAFL